MEPKEPASSEAIVAQAVGERKPDSGQYSMPDRAVELIVQFHRYTCFQELKKRRLIMPCGKHLKIIIAVDGQCAVDAINFTGPACQAATMEIAAALGGQIDRQHDKPEARIRERGVQSEQERAR